MKKWSWRSPQALVAGVAVVLSGLGAAYLLRRPDYAALPAPPATEPISGGLLTPELDAGQWDSGLPDAPSPAVGVTTIDITDTPTLVPVTEQPASGVLNLDAGSITKQTQSDIVALSPQQIAMLSDSLLRSGLQKQTITLSGRFRASNQSARDRYRHVV